MFVSLWRISHTRAADLIGVAGRPTVIVLLRAPVLICVIHSLAFNIGEFPDTTVGLFDPVLLPNRAVRGQAIIARLRRSERGIHAVCW